MADCAIPNYEFLWWNSLVKVSKCISRHVHLRDLTKTSSGLSTGRFTLQKSCH